MNNVTADEVLFVVATLACVCNCMNNVTADEVLFLVATLTWPKFKYCVQSWKPYF